MGEQLAGTYPEKVEDGDVEEREEGFSEGETCRVSVLVADFERVDGKERGSLLQSLVYWGVTIFRDHSGSSCRGGGTVG